MTFVFLCLKYKATLSDGNTNLWWGVIKHKQYKRVVVEFPSTTNITSMLSTEVQFNVFVSMSYGVLTHSCYVIYRIYLMSVLL